jgi:Holliday junction resolvase
LKIICGGLEICMCILPHSFGDLVKDPKRVKAGRKSKRKGNNAERNLAKLLQEWWNEPGVTFQRTPSSGGWATKAAREEFRTSGDVLTSAKNFPWTVENKCQEGWSLDAIRQGECAKVWDWYAQAMEETSLNCRPMLVISRNRVKPLVILQNDDVAVDLLEEASGCLGWPLQYPHGSHDHYVVIFPLSTLLSVSSNIFKNIIKKE